MMMVMVKSIRCNDGKIPPATVVSDGTFPPNYLDVLFINKEFWHRWMFLFNKMRLIPKTSKDDDDEDEDEEEESDDDDDDDDEEEEEEE